jgi:ubiquinone/menaquinone biosynthesis C-methylase UbiE
MEKMNAQFDEFATFYDKAFTAGTRPVAADALTHMPPITSTSIIHDNACGPGVVTFLITDNPATQSLIPVPSIHSTDLAEGMIKATQAGIETRKLKNVTAKIMNAQDLSGFEDETFTHSITNFVIFALPEPVKAASEIYRTLKLRGFAAVMTWRTTGSIELFKRVQKHVRPNEPIIDPLGKDWSEDWKIKDVMVEGGFTKEKVKVVRRDSVWTPNGGIDELVRILSHPYWSMFQQGWSDDEKAKWPVAVRECLSDEERSTASLKMDAWICVAEK